MNINRFENLLCSSLYKSIENILTSLTITAPELKSKGIVESNHFMIYLHRKINKVFSYVKKPDKTKPLIMRANTDNFTFTYTVFPDNRSNINIKMLLSAGRDYDSDYIEHKIKHIFGYVYILKSDYGYKIGCTSNFEKRLNTFSVKLPFDVTPHSFIKCKDWEKLESFLHEKLTHKKINGEWYNLTENDFIDIDVILSNMKLERTLEYE
jgi:hypothetical protein